jgi:hypothetical protein
MEKLLLPTVDLEQWYQELMAGLGTGPVAVSPRSSPPPLPAKASRQLQVTLTACPPQVFFLPPVSIPADPLSTQCTLAWGHPRRTRRGSWEGSEGLCPSGTLGSWRANLLSPRMSCLIDQCKGVRSRVSNPVWGPDNLLGLL